MAIHTQYEIFAAKLGDEWASRIVPCKVEMAWAFPSGTSFETMNVTPSLDASASGHWHGFITGGQIVGGEQMP